MFDNEGGGGGERNGISANKGPSSGSSGSLQAPEARIPRGCVGRGSLEKKHLSPHSPASFIIFFPLRRNTLLRVTLKYLPKPEEGEKENGGVAGLDVLISPRKTEWGALDSSSQGKQQQRTPRRLLPGPLFLRLHPGAPSSPPLRLFFLLILKAGPDNLLEIWKERQ